MVRFWVPKIIRHLIFRYPKKGTLILTTTHMVQAFELFRVYLLVQLPTRAQVNPCDYIGITVPPKRLKFNKP